MMAGGCTAVFLLVIYQTNLLQHNPKRSFVGVCDTGKVTVSQHLAPKASQTSVLTSNFSPAVRGANSPLLLLARVNLCHQTINTLVSFKFNHSLDCCSLEISISIFAIHVCHIFSEILVVSPEQPEPPVLAIWLS